jgi:hypothetical protein
VSDPRVAAAVKAVCPKCSGHFWMDQMVKELSAAKVAK